MKMIVISEERFDELFEATLDRLKLGRFVEGGGVSRSSNETAENTPIGQLHRAFHYEVCKLKEKLKRD